MSDPREREPPPRRWSDGATVWLIVILVAIVTFIVLVRIETSH